MSIPKSDCQGEDPIMILVERLRQSARISTAPEMNPQGFPIEKNLYWRAAEALLSLRQERDLLWGGITDTIELIRVWANDEGFPVESSACFQRLSAALHKDQAS